MFSRQQIFFSLAILALVAGTTALQAVYLERAATERVAGAAAMLDLTRRTETPAAPQPAAQALAAPAPAAYYPPAYYPPAYYPPFFPGWVDAACYYGDSTCYYGPVGSLDLRLLPSRVSSSYPFAGQIYGAEGGRYLSTVAGLLVSSDGGLTWKRAP
jgi:hypothetical protein